MRVKDIMIEEVVSLKPEDNVRDSLNLLLKKEISGLPVIDKEGKLVGMFTEKNILDYILPSYIENVGRFIYKENPKAIKRKFGELAKIKIEKMMREDVVTTTEDTTLCEVAKMMLMYKARRIPVLDKMGKVVGIISRGDVLKALAKEGEIVQ
ncbi:MAG: CBS domain-containing protein [Candidatus Omnitrophica bacterium]|nr:CBS domain-containing protein [Candidatus Omnitrophota bacterium]